MTREIGDILIQQTVDSDYEIERKVKIIEKIEKLVIASLNLTAAITERKADQEAKKVEAREMIQNGASVRETQEATGLSFRQTAKISQEVHTQENMQKYNVPQEVAEKVTRVQEAIKAEEDVLMPVRPTRMNKVTDNNTDNNTDNTSDNITDNDIDNTTDNVDSEPQKDEPVLEIATYNADDEKAIAMKRLVGLTGLKRAAMAATIERYFRDKQAFEDAYRDEAGMKFAYTLDDYIDGERYNS